ncbi:hypothetical protein NCCP2331_00880 [Sporosarcina sp. NCCP-2331]|nr:hypothetical protein NCCP2331_00880 [Sporosarcina sp. NCCP-2331]GLB54715.1 hypothetical protein NCCP2378_05000 [Sporosarcina sp. NCCP-2378]
MIIVPAQSLIVQPHPLIDIGCMIIRLSYVIIQHTGMIIEPISALIAALQLCLCGC